MPGRCSRRRGTLPITHDGCFVAVAADGKRGAATGRASSRRGRAERQSKQKFLHLRERSVRVGKQRSGRREPRLSRGNDHLRNVAPCRDRCVVCRGKRLGWTDRWLVLEPSFRQSSKRSISPRSLTKACAPWSNAARPFSAVPRRASPRAPEAWRSWVFQAKAAGRPARSRV
jgi:hypothetical protein